MTRFPTVSFAMSTLSDTSTTSGCQQDDLFHASRSFDCVPYLPSGCTFTRTFFVPITFTTSPT